MCIACALGGGAWATSWFSNFLCLFLIHRILRNRFFFFIRIQDATAWRAWTCLCNNKSSEIYSQALHSTHLYPALLWHRQRWVCIYELWLLHLMDGDAEECFLGFYGIWCRLFPNWKTNFQIYLVKWWNSANESIDKASGSVCCGCIPTCLMNDSQTSITLQGDPENASAPNTHIKLHSVEYKEAYLVIPIWRICYYAFVWNRHDVMCIVQLAIRDQCVWYWCRCGSKDAFCMKMCRPDDLQHLELQCWTMSKHVHQQTKNKFATSILNFRYCLIDIMLTFLFAVPLPT